MRDQGYGARLLIAVQNLKASGRYNVVTLGDLLKSFDCMVDEYEKIKREVENGRNQCSQKP